MRNDRLRPHPLHAPLYDLMKCCSPPIHKKTIVAMATVGQASGAKLKKHSPLRIGDTIMLYFNADKRSKDEAENSGYILSDLSV